MNQIKFSHDYWKLPKDANGKQAKLLHIEPIELERQNASYLIYDTHIREPEDYRDSHPKIQRFYELPKAGYYLLLLFSCEGMIFTTLRRYSVEKEKHYRSKISEKFEVVVE